jgi:hypothetical protein
MKSISEASYNTILFETYQESNLRDALLNQRSLWTQEHDELLVHWLNILSDKYQIAPTTLQMNQLIKSRYVPSYLIPKHYHSLYMILRSIFANLNSSLPTKDSNKDTSQQGFSFCEKFSTKFSPLFIAHSDEDLLLRALLLIHLNDLVFPLMAFISFEDGQAAVNHPSSLLRSLRGIYDSHDHCSHCSCY